jgi:hypothetical protein
MPQVTAPPFEDYELQTREGDVVRVAAQLLGHGSSYFEGKTRWFEVFIYRTRDGRYLVHRLGQTSEPGETVRFQLERTSSAFEVVELLTSRTHSNEVHIPRPSVRAIAQAAAFDDKIRDAYINRGPI